MESQARTISPMPDISRHGSEFQSGGEGTRPPTTSGGCKRRGRYGEGCGVIRAPSRSLCGAGRRNPRWQSLPLRLPPSTRRRGRTAAPLPRLPCRRSAPQRRRRPAPRGRRSPLPHRCGSLRPASGCRVRPRSPPAPTYWAGWCCITGPATAGSLGRWPGEVGPRAFPHVVRNGSLTRSERLSESTGTALWLSESAGTAIRVAQWSTFGLAAQCHPSCSALRASLTIA